MVLDKIVMLERCIQGLRLTFPLMTGSVLGKLGPFKTSLTSMFSLDYKHLETVILDMFYYSSTVVLCCQLCLSVTVLRKMRSCLFNCYELSWWFYINGKKQLHKVIDTSSETPNRHIIVCWFVSCGGRRRNTGAACRMKDFT